MRFQHKRILKIRHVYIPEFKADFHSIVPLHSGTALHLHSTSMFLRRRRDVAQSVGVDDKVVSSCHACSVWITKKVKTVLINGQRRRKIKSSMQLKGKNKSVEDFPRSFHWTFFSYSYCPVNEYLLRQEVFRLSIDIIHDLSAFVLMTLH